MGIGLSYGDLRINTPFSQFSDAPHRMVRLALSQSGGGDRYVPRNGRALVSLSPFDRTFFGVGLAYVVSYNVTDYRLGVYGGVVQ